MTYYYVRSDAPPHPLRKTDASPGDGAGNANGYGTIGVSSPAPMPSSAADSGSQFPALQQGKVNPYAVPAAGGLGIPDGHLKVVVQASGEGPAGAAGKASASDHNDIAGNAPPSYTATVKGDNKIQRD